MCHLAKTAKRRENVRQTTAFQMSMIQTVKHNIHNLLCLFFFFLQKKSKKNTLPRTKTIVCYLPLQEDQSYQTAFYLSTTRQHARFPAWLEPEPNSPD